MNILTAYQTHEHVPWSDPAQLSMQTDPSAHKATDPRTSIRVLSYEITCQIYTSYSDFPLGPHHSILQLKAFIYS